MEGKWAPQIGKENKKQYNSKELNDEFGLNWNDYGARFYDSAIGRFTTTDRFTEKYVHTSPYQYGLNNPISNIDINGDSVWVASRALDIPGVGGAAVHTFLVAKPDENNPNGDTFYFSFYKGEDGDLVGTAKKVSTDENGEETVTNLWGDSDWNSDQGWNSSDLKDLELIETPDGKTDSEFIDAIGISAKALDDKNLKYRALTTQANCETSGNCNSAVTTILTQAGTPLSRVNKINPSGLNPGIGVQNEKGRSIGSRVATFIENLSKAADQLKQ